MTTLVIQNFPISAVLKGNLSSSSKPLTPSPAPSLSWLLVRFTLPRFRGPESSVSNAPLTPDDIASRTCSCFSLAAMCPLLMLHGPGAQPRAHTHGRRGCIGCLPGAQHATYAGLQAIS